MTKEEIQALYKAHILPENKHPYHFEAKEGTSVSFDAYNPMCGDKFHLYLNVVNDVFDTVHFDGIGCAISKASTSMLLKKIEGMSKIDAKAICEKFINNLTNDHQVDEFNDELNTLIALKHFDGRIDCIKLAWEALLNYLLVKDLEG
ncbi:MAG: SUF system NifU family Fe-S cluster assembly protein [Cyclobacteriaceae bacterium]|nr:SUF system NifU family Fe-S cluster assembly protein [Cyclobacteriaceae bacterium]